MFRQSLSPSSSLNSVSLPYLASSRASTTRSHTFILSSRHPSHFQSSSGFPSYSQHFQICKFLHYSKICLSFIFLILFISLILLVNLLLPSRLCVSPPRCLAKIKGPTSWRTWEGPQCGECEGVPNVARWMELEGFRARISPVMSFSKKLERRRSTQQKLVGSQREQTLRWVYEYGVQCSLPLLT